MKILGARHKNGTAEIASKMKNIQRKNQLCKSDVFSLIAIHSYVISCASELVQFYGLRLICTTLAAIMILCALGRLALGLYINNVIDKEGNDYSLSAIKRMINMEDTVLMISLSVLQFSFVPPYSTPWMD